MIRKRIVLSGWWTAGLLVITLAGSLGCAAMRDLVTMSKPELKVNDVRLTGLSFDALSLLVEVGIKNPNPVSVPLAGFDYEFRIAGETFLEGDQPREQSIPAGGEGSLEIPLKIPFKELYSAFKNLTQADSTEYTLAAGLRFDLPVLGATRIPVRTSGHLPLVKIPKIRLSNIKLEKLSFTRADLALQVEIENGNAFGFLINTMKYDLAVNGASWARGITSQAMQIRQKDKSRVTIPVSLDLARTGRTVYSLLRGNRELDYRLTGELDLESTLSLLGKVALPFDRTGKIALTR